MLYTSCILQTRWGFCDYRSQIHEQYAIICRVTFSIVNYEFAHTANGEGNTTYDSVLFVNLTPVIAKAPSSLKDTASIEHLPKDNINNW